MTALRNEIHVQKLLDRGYNLILFFSLPFIPLKQKAFRRRINYGHLAVSLGDTVYQMVEPERLKSNFLVSRMPLNSWLYEDGPWHEWDMDSDDYRHVHLFERAEVKRTSVFYAALNSYPESKIIIYKDYFERVEDSFQNGKMAFKLLTDNCSHMICEMFYREGWLGKHLFDFLPAHTYKRLVRAWHHKGHDCTVGFMDENRQRDQFDLQRVCPGVFSFDARLGMIRWVQNKEKQYRRMRQKNKKAEHLADC